MREVVHKHTCIYPSITGKTLIIDFEISEFGKVEMRRRMGKHMSIETIVEALRAHDPRIPIFVDTAYPEVIDALRKKGFWIVR